MTHGTHRPHAFSRASADPAAPTPRRGAAPRTSSSGTSGTRLLRMRGGAAAVPPQASVAAAATTSARSDASSHVVAAPLLSPALMAALDRATQGAPEVSLLFSGGLDSTLLAHLLMKVPRFREPGRIALVTIGLLGCGDLDQAATAARALGLPWEGRAVTPEQVREAAGAVRAMETRAEIRGPPPEGMRLEVLTGLRLALERAPTTRVLCGQGADELFLGYAHFVPLQGDRLEQRFRRDLLQLQKEDWPATQRIAAELAKDLRAPYLDPEVLRGLDDVPLEARRRPGEPKALLREQAVMFGLPQELALRKKKALQYGSGVHHALARS